MAKPSIKDIKAKALSEMRYARNVSGDDPEAAHILADKLLSQLLRDLGCADIAEEFDMTTKWYS